jgi:hypothetical protein
MIVTDRVSKQRADALSEWMLKHAMLRPNGTRPKKICLGV